MTLPELRPIARGPDEGEDLWILGGLYSYKALTEETGNAYLLVEVQGPRGFAAPLHFHDDEEEGFYVVRGRVRIVLGDRTVEAPAGSYALAPRGVRHAFVFDSPDTTLLLLLSPGGKHQALFRAIGEPATRHEIPPAPTSSPDLEKMAETAGRHGTRMVGPPPK